MSYQSGMDAYKAGNYQQALDEFHAVIESDEQDHKAWNALGVTYTKTGYYDQADICYENAITLAPENAAYERNRQKNREKMQPEDVLTVEDDEPKDWKIKPRPKISILPILGRPWWNYFVGAFVLFFLVAIVAGMAGGGSSKQVSMDSKPASLAGNAVTFQPTHQVTVEPIGDKYNGFTVSDVRMEKDQYLSYIVGSVINSKSKKMTYLQIEINLYDDSGAQVGSTMANINNLEPGATWKFKAMVTSRDATKHEIKEITGW